MRSIHPLFKVLLAGCGGMAAHWLSATIQRRDLRLVGFVDLKLSAAQTSRDEFDPSADFLSEPELKTSPLVPYPDKENGRVSLFAEFVNHVRGQLRSRVRKLANA